MKTTKTVKVKQSNGFKKVPVPNNDHKDYRHPKVPAPGHQNKKKTIYNLAMHCSCDQMTPSPKSAWSANLDRLVWLGNANNHETKIQHKNLSDKCRKIEFYDSAKKNMVWKFYGFCVQTWSDVLKSLTRHENANEIVKVWKCSGNWLSSRGNQTSICKFPF